MNNRYALCLVLVSAALISFHPLHAAAKDDDVAGKVHHLLALYSHKDIIGVMSLVGDGNIVVMGSDLSEVCTNRQQVEEMLRNDFQLWDSAFFGDLRNMFIQRSGDLVTAFFDVPFTLRRDGNEQSVVIRFATVWRKTRNGLKLVQSSNTVPTIGQSARKLLAPKR